MESATLSTRCPATSKRQRGTWTLSHPCGPLVGTDRGGTRDAATGRFELRPSNHSLSPAVTWVAESCEPSSTASRHIQPLKAGWQQPLNDREAERLRAESVPGRGLLGVDVAALGAINQPERRGRITFMRSMSNGVVVEPFRRERCVDARCPEGARRDGTSRPRRYVDRWLR